MIGGGTREQEARDQAERDVHQVLADGLATPGRRVLVLEEDATGARVGTLWFAEQQRGGRTTVYLYDLAIDEAHRGKGLGREAMLLFEDMALDLGAKEIDLAVFGGNTRELAVYESLGYSVTVRLMPKTLVDDAAP